jgi:hypothetical protein
MKKTTKKTTAKTAKAAKPNRKQTIIDLISRAKGATLAELMNATGWQAHSIRGMISILGSKHGVKIASSKNDAGERFYIAAAPKATAKPKKAVAKPASAAAEAAA